MKITNKKLGLNLLLNSITEDNDPTILKAKYIVLDFNVSHNNAILEREIGIELGKSIKNKPIVAKYIPVNDVNTSTDNFTGHEASLGKNKHGEQTVSTDTIPIGVFTSEGYIETVNFGGIDTEVLVADAVLWRSRFSDACELIVEWYNRGININTSCEFLYNNFIMQDGIEYVKSPVWFEGHAHLASENRGDQGVVLPAYDSSKLLSLNEINKFNKMIAQAKEEGENLKFKKVFELSHSDVRSQIYSKLDPTLPEGSYSYIYDVYDTHFVVQIEDSSSMKYYNFNYTKSDNDITVDVDSKSEVIEKREWVSASETQALQTQLNETQEKFNEATEKLTSLNAIVEELKPFKEQFESEQFEKCKNEKIEFYSAKFEAVNGAEKFGTEEVQNLIIESINADEQGQKAILKLNSILVDLVKPISKPEKPNFIKEFASRNEKLVNFEEGFASRYTI
ncbi:hypothetical protein BSK66_26720 [Paenibacillus odorifer]|uniref:hypothetical protein n=1 Tax=Paenibacillus TaxID=44249 RepID=UPI0003E22BB1|nr:MULTISPECIES: hypothetical protein [Paenibacillus]ETT49342.1 hypothetical protein C171_23755 [Paenibacillus sp. FSL H8-237]OME49554.1 hypothetical protein BSK66_26720 [Paenibacillus odorifer]